jgi:ABC-type multidrug transport system ATPase subunit
MYCVETENIVHKFSEKETVLNNINLQVPTGAIYGFLGPNGAGKTTTLRLILGLLKKQQGSINIFGKSLHTHRVDILKKTGCLIESPSLYGHLTATENLRVLQTVYQCPTSRINYVLEMVGLTSTGNKKAARFSLGMKQRLSIAVALLHNPELLILDEPTNGLDPNGILEIRELLKKLNEEHQLTILISSHLLSEIEKMVTYVGIINKGNMLFQGTLAGLRQKQIQDSVIQFNTSNEDKTISILLLNGLAPTVINGVITIPLIDKQKVAALNAQLVHAGIDVYQVSLVKNDLESIFMDIINK